MSPFHGLDTLKVKLRWSRMELEGFEPSFSLASLYYFYVCSRWFNFGYSTASDSIWATYPYL